MVLFNEIQRGSEAMEELMYGKDFPHHAACVLRLLDGSEYSGDHPSRVEAKANRKPEGYAADSWFASVIVAEQMSARGHAFVGPVKQNSTRCPKEEIEELMKGWPSGSSIVFECKTEAGHDLVCVGYKYNARKCLTFIATKNAGSTLEGDPYVARFPDPFGNVKTRNVRRPQLISHYFSLSNRIDNHNHARQYELALEKQWVTQSGFFRLDVTFLGMTVVDCWKAFKHSVEDAELNKMTIIEYADRLAYDCIYNLEQEEVDNSFIPLGLTVDASVDVDRPAEVSPLTVRTVSSSEISVAAIYKEHFFKRNPDKSKDGKSKRRTCRTEGCKETTSWMCCNRFCKSVIYNTNGLNKKGLFYCEDHWDLHRLEEVERAVAMAHEIVER
jgi:hypothetical protein